MLTLSLTVVPVERFSTATLTCPSSAETSEETAADSFWPGSSVGEADGLELAEAPAVALCVALVLGVAPALGLVLALGSLEAPWPAPASVFDATGAAAADEWPGPVSAKATATRASAQTPASRASPRARVRRMRGQARGRGFGIFRTLGADL